MYKKSFLRPILIVGLITIIFVACDKGFNELGTDIVGDDHFGFDVDSTFTVKAYNQKLGPIASNNLPINALGFYSNPAFGTTTANFVTQVELSTLNPVFNNTNTELYDDLPVIDSVIMDIPYFKTLTKTVVESEVRKNTYRLDSIYGEKPYDQTTATLNSKFKLSVYQSNYFLRDLDPNQSLTEQQLFYTDENSVIDANKIPVLLNNSANTNENEEFYFDKREHKLTTYQADGTTLVDPAPRSVPSMRLHLRSDVFYDKILNAPSGQLANNTLFKNYFRGIYFKVENGNPGNMAMINFRAGKITIFYKEDKITKDNPATTTINEYKKERVSKSFPLNLSGNTISLLKNSNENAEYLNAANSSNEASRLYLKGGEGSISYIDLFGSTDLKGYVKNDSFNENLPISVTNPKYILTGPNGISDEIDDIKYNGWLINEANLTFYIDKSATNMSDSKTVEPNRIYLYDLTNKNILLDYTFDFTADGNFPKRNKFIFGGILLNKNGSITKQKKDETTDLITEKGYKYSLRITNYVRNLIKNDSTNVRLGLSVTENINIVGFSKLRNANSNLNSAPTMSVLSPLGTILYGTGATSTSLPEGKKLKLKIYYTKPN
jgi:hypothetical protein